MRMRKVKWATDYLPTASCLVKEPSKQAGNWKKLLDTDTLHIEIGCGKGNFTGDRGQGSRKGCRDRLLRYPCDG